MTRIIKGFAVDWGDRWRRTVWAQLEHIYWFNVLPDQQVEFDRSSSPAALLRAHRERHAGNSHRASASDHTLGLRGRELGPDQLDQQIDGEAVVHF